MGTDADTYLITGSTGKTGRRVTALLRARAKTVREASRHSAIPFDWNEDSTWPAALDNIDAVYLVLPDLGSPAAIDRTRAFSEQAASAGVTRAVMVSFPESGGVDDETTAMTERQVTEAGIALTVLRLRWFTQNFSEDFLLEAVLSTHLHLPAGDGREAFVDADDVAEVAVATLTEPGHAGRSYELTGPRALSFSEIAAELSRAANKHISYLAVTREEFIAEQEAQQVPTEWANTLADLFSSIASGYLASTTDDIQIVLRRPARDFCSYARDAASTGVWNS